MSNTVKTPEEITSEYLKNNTLWAAMIGESGRKILKDGIRVGLEYAAQSSSKEWVSVDERLPTEADADEDGFVLALWHNEIREVVKWTMVTSEYFSHWIAFSCVPLPTPPSTPKD